MRDDLSVRGFWLCMALLLLGSVTKHVLTLSTGPTAMVDDAHDYWNRGVRCAEGDWWQVEGAVNYRTPLYPLLIGLCQRTMGSHALLTLAVIQHVLQMFTGWIVAASCYGISGKRWVCVAGYGMSVLCVTRPWYANVVLTETLFLFFLTASFGLLVAYYLRPSSPRAAAFAALLGMAILTRPVPKYLWIPLVTLFFVQCSTLQDVQRISRHAVFAILALAAVLTPWWIRNALVLDEASVASVPPINKWVVCFHDRSGGNLPIPNSPAGQQLLMLLPELAQGTPQVRDGYRVIDRLRSLGFSEAAVDQLISAVCADAIRNEPATFCWQTFKRFVNYWRCSVKPYPYYSSYQATPALAVDRQQSWRIEPLASWYEQILSRAPSQTLRWMEFDSLLCGLGMLLLIARRRTRLIGLSLAAMCLYFAAVTAALEIECYRYRLILDPCLIIAATCGIAGSFVKSVSRPEIGMGIAGDSRMT